jgi:hypothetical protein
MMPHIPRGLLGASRDEKDEEERRRRQGGGNGLLAPFMPGDQQALAQQMAMGFGGSPQANMRYLQALYSKMPMNFNYQGIGGGGMGGGMGGQVPGQPPAPVRGGTDPNYRLSPVGWSPK